MNQTLHGLNRDKFTQVTFQHKQNLQEIIGLTFTLKATGPAEPLNEKKQKKGKMEKVRLRKPILLHPTRKIKLGKPARMAEGLSIANVLAADLPQLTYTLNK